MNLTITPRGILQIDDARIAYKNFEGRGDKYNRQGDRNFVLIIPEENMAQELISQGWNVKIKPSRDEGDTPFMYLPVKVKFTDRGPNVYLVSGSARNKLDEESVGMLDNIDIASIDMDIRPYDWEVNGKTGRTAYLHAMSVVQNIDRFAAKWQQHLDGCDLTDDDAF